MTDGRNAGRDTGSRTRTRRGDGLSTALIVLGSLLIVGALALAGYNWWDSMRAGAASTAVVDQIANGIGDGTLKAPAPKGVPAGIGSSDEGDMTESIMVGEDGYAYLGILGIPSIEVELPVMDDWDMDRMLVSPCRYAGSYLSYDMVVCGHNYASHLGSLQYVSPGDDVYFTTVDGVAYHYQVLSIEILQPTAIEQMVLDVDDEWDLTIFTCTLGGQERVTVRCVRV